MNITLFMYMSSVTHEQVLAWERRVEAQRAQTAVLEILKANKQFDAVRLQKQGPNVQLSVSILESTPAHLSLCTCILLPLCLVPSLILLHFCYPFYSVYGISMEGTVLLCCGLNLLFKVSNRPSTALHVSCSVSVIACRN